MFLFAGGPTLLTDRKGAKDSRIESQVCYGSFLEINCTATSLRFHRSKEEARMFNSPGKQTTSACIPGVLAGVGGGLGADGDVGQDAEGPPQSSSRGQLFLLACRDSVGTRLLLHLRVTSYMCS